MEGTSKAINATLPLLSFKALEGANAGGAAKSFFFNGHEVKVIHQTKKVHNIKLCSICLNSLETGKVASFYLDAHVYHVDCIKTWFEKAKTCPDCRKHLHLDQLIEHPSLKELQSCKNIKDECINKNCLIIGTEEDVKEKLPRLCPYTRLSSCEEILSLRERKLTLINVFEILGEELQKIDLKLAYFDVVLTKAVPSSRYREASPREISLHLGDKDSSSFGFIALLDKISFADIDKIMSALQKELKKARSTNSDHLFFEDYDSSRGCFMKKTYVIEECGNSTQYFFKKDTHKDQWVNNGSNGIHEEDQRKS
jgi:hypothetical protein